MTDETKTVTITDSGIQGALGRNGYFKPARIEVVRLGVGSKYDTVRVDVFAQRSRDYGPAWFEITPEEARTLAACLEEAARRSTEEVSA